MAKLDWNEYIEKAVQVNAEGAVLVRNQGGLPLDKNSETAVFGRIQLDYYKSGTGSGGMVNVTKVTGITDGLIEAGAKLNEELLQTYRDWFAENPHDFGEGWGGEPWCQKEMPVSDELAAKAAQTAQAALVVIGRTAGEEQDNSNTAGSYKLTDDELEMLKTVRKHFKRMIVVLNVGNIIDMSFVDEFEPEAVLYIWQGGMTGGTGAARVLLGEVSPSGKLPDTIAYDVTDYPSDKYFHNTERNFYTEDIYVGYRWFETFAKEKVRYPFGFGLSYTDFEISASGSYDGEKVTVTAAVKNIGNCAGKEVVQVYCEAPQGKLGKPSRVLCGFEKTKELAPGEEQTLTITVEERKFSSYDDSGVTGYPYAWVLEEGVYKIYAGSDVRDAEEICAFKLNETELVQQLSQALAPVMEFERIVNKDGSPAFEKVPLSKIDEKQRRNELMPEEIAFTGDRGFKLADVKNGKCTLDGFIAQLDDTDLNVLVRGEGMCSPKVTPGTAAAFGGVSEHLKQMGVPCGCCSDGPSGMRLDTGTKAFSLPNGTLIASTFNKPLVQELFAFLGLEMRANNVDCLLGPGMNIHRHPLNGRNFEYLSEDPYLTGVMAASELRGLHSQGVEGTIKHFCGNNQETNRHFLDSAISERALREIYLRGFEMAVKCGKNRSVMTTYGKVNDLWTAGSFDLDTVILRQQWGFDGFAMTDWWANINDRGCAPDKNNFAAMVRAQNDVYMVCANSEQHTDNIQAALADGTLTRAELQRCAKNVLSFLLDTHAMKRMMNADEKVEVINKPDETIDAEAASRVYYLEDELEIDLSDVKVRRNMDHSFTIERAKEGAYSITITASSNASELAQMPITIFCVGTSMGTFTWNGTGGKPVSHTVERAYFFSRFSVVRLHFRLAGIDPISIKFKRLAD